MSVSKIRVLLVDDNQNFCKSFINRHDSEEFEVFADYSLDKAKQTLQEDFFSYHFVVLDGLGLLFEGETEGQGNDGFAMAAVQEIRALATKFGRALPYCLYTAFHEDRVLNALKQADSSLEIYKKTISEDEPRMWQYIRDSYKKL